jgi:peptidyl-prolyl cis-trans isomerase A (cyclophilin A)
MAQFGISGDPEITSLWKSKAIPDDPVTMSNVRGTLSFATSGKNTRTAQVFINFADNSFLDKQGFSPFAQVISGMDVVDRIYSGYGEGGNGDGKDNRGPSQGLINRNGNKYLESVFPKLSYINSSQIIS